ncbi:hypothetical protein, conserved [Leishmania tarentolae]|uniref:Uncharacterized protein n=1 Tax=Leishmania tarentolae TaxID=5689 RepID=A0A640KHF7_LEITA|nr:hypothetical protein, conserved [Leishmania tarentolae]
MLKLSRASHSSRYTPVVGYAFLVEMLYGSKYSANLGLYSMPYVYVKTILLCTAGSGLKLREGRYIHGLVELLLPSKASQDNLTKLELLQFIDAIPMDRCANGNDESSTADEEEAEDEAIMALILHGNDDASNDGPTAASIHAEYCTSSPSPLYDESRAPKPSLQTCRDESHKRVVGDSACDHGGDDVPARLSSDAAADAGAVARSRAEEAEDDAAAMESIMPFVSATAFPSSIARVLIYDAVCTCLADGVYTAKEKERVALLSSHIGLFSAVRGQIEKLALQEKVISIRKRRLLLLQPAHSNKAPKREGWHPKVLSTLDNASNSSPHGQERSGADAVDISGVGDRLDHHDAENEADTFAEEAVRVESAKKLLRRARAHRSSKRYVGI